MITNHPQQAKLSVDLLVYGATSAGVCAAVAAADHGASVLLAEPGRHVGGMTSGGLGYTDVGDTRVLGGMAARFRQQVADHYRVAPGHYAGPEPHVAELIFEQWLTAADVDVRFEQHLRGATVTDGRITAVDFGSGLRVEAGLVIDAGYEGDLMAAAGVSSVVGREDRDLYGERFAGRQELLPGRHTMPPWISPFADDPDGIEEGALLPQVFDRPFAPIGAGDGGVMSYGYRVCLTTAADRIPIERPDDYDEAYWELGRRLFRYWERVGFRPSAGYLIGLQPNLPAGKCDGNSLGPFSLSVLDGSAWRYPDAQPAERAAIRRHHRRHTRGFLHFLSHDPAVPAGVRTEMQRWGYPADEFADTGHLPHQLYVREARRMLGTEVLTEHDLLSPQPRGDTVALGSYHIDVREVQRGWRWVYEHPRPRGMVFTEGYLSVPVPAYPIGYRHLLPRRSEVTNLLVPVCISASHVAFASARMEVQYQMLGQAAGVAAALALRTGSALHDLDTDRLQETLRADHAVLTAPPGERSS